MKQRYVHIGLAQLCDVFGKTRQTYYERIWQQEKQQMEVQLVVDLIQEKRHLMPRIGGLKLHHLLQEKLQGHGIKLGRDKLFALLREKDLLVKPKKRRTKTTHSYHHFHRYPNLIRELEVSRSNEVWVSDITYIAIRKHYAYLSLITDVYSHRVVGYSLYKTLERKGCILALAMALNSIEKQVESLIHHSDRGIQYCSHEYVGILKQNNIQVSMTEQKDAYENALAERVNGILKGEFGLDQGFYSFTTAEREISSTIAIYNGQRPHLSCDMLTPDQAHLKQGVLPKRWKNYWQLKNKQAFENHKKKKDVRENQE